MCRFVAYKGQPILVDDLLFRPNHSLIKQSFEAKELEEPLNGDGFGLGWYTKELTNTPAVFVSMTPAWSNRNLKNLAGHIKTECVFAHVRAASVGDISESNCHPFTFGKWMFMHNGGIEDFAKIKREVRRSLSDDVYNWVRGQTDSEHFFALILEKLLASKKEPGIADVKAAILSAVGTIEELKAKHQLSSETFLNICITNGQFVIATRYASHTSDPYLSLYFSKGTRYVCEGGVCHIERGSGDKHTAMIVSEPITSIAQDWTAVPGNHFVVIDEKNNVSTEAMDLNAIPKNKKHGA